MSGPNPLGPISQGESVCLCTLIGNIPYVMVKKSVTDFNNNTFNVAIFVQLYVSGPSGGDYSINTDISNLTIIRSTLAGNLPTPSMTITSPSEFSGKQLLLVKGFNGSSNEVFTTLPLNQNIQYQTEQANFTSSYQIPPSPGLLFSAAPYTISQQNALNPIYFYGGENIPATIRYQSSPIYFLPVSFFIDSSPQAEQKVCQQQTNNPLLSVQLFACGLCPNVIGCSTCTQTTNQRAWTRAADCQNNFVYQYCGIGQFCSSCYGICSVNQSSECQYTPANNGSFSCSSNDAPVIPVIPGLPGVITPVPVTPWYRQTWVILLFLVIIIVVLILVGYRYYERRNMRDVTTSTTGAQTVS